MAKRSPGEKTRSRRTSKKEANESTPASAADGVLEPAPPPSKKTDQTEEESILKEFVVECGEMLGRLDQEFVALEKDPANASLLGGIFRTIHTIKGTCGFLGLPKLEKIAHGTEEVLSAMRDGKMLLTPRAVTTLLAAVDTIKEILTHIEAEAKEPDQIDDTIRQKLDALLAGDDVSPIKPTHAIPPREGERVPPASPLGEGTGEKAIGPSKAALEESEQPSATKASTSETSLRVDVGLLDRLMNLVGELVLARNQLLQQVRERDDAAETGTAQRMNLITTELQDTVMKTRMQPIRNIWEKFPRLVRDLTQESGKQVDLVMDGIETELDKTLLEAIKDPLTHIVRNAVDHGIEPPEVRTSRGKGAQGRLFLKAYHEGGQINIEVSDDGGGIDLERVKQKAVEKGLIRGEAAPHLSERDAMNLIFLPGLSTAEQITHVSGRGVGMDVVKTNIEKIGGTIEIKSRLKEGTTLRIKIPLTLAIIPALMVTAGQQRFAVPQAGLLELIRVDRESGEQIEMIQGAEFYRLRGALLPILRLKKILGLNRRPDEMTEMKGPNQGESETNMVVLEAGGDSFGLVVDEISDSEEIVVKPLGRQLKALSTFAGATIMGDGQVALILDVAGIAKQGGLLQEKEEHSDLDAEDQTEEVKEAERQTFLVFSLSRRDRYAVPLELVTRLEEIDPTKIEQVVGRELMQYRGELLPLVRLDKALGFDSQAEPLERLPLIVFSKNQKSVGLVVGQIVDIVEAEKLLHPPPAGKIGVQGSLVIGGQITDLLDIDPLIERAEPEWLEAHAGVGEERDGIPG